MKNYVFPFTIYSKKYRPGLCMVCFRLFYILQGYFPGMEGNHMITFVPVNESWISGGDSYESTEKKHKTKQDEINHNVNFMGYTVQMLYKIILHFATSRWIPQYGRTPSGIYGIEGPSEICTQSADVRLAVSGAQPLFTLGLLMFALSLVDFLSLLLSPSTDIKIFYFCRKFHLKDTYKIFK